MIAFVTTSIPQLDSWREQTPDIADRFGRLFTPRMYGAIGATIKKGYPFALDNDGFGGMDYNAWLHTLARIPKEARWVSLPDSVGNAAETMRLYMRWMHIVGDDLGLRRAYVIQDGIESVGIPWDNCEAIFIGGLADGFKTSAHVRGIVREAKRRDKWVHMGRVSSVERGAAAREMGCDSFDGSRFARFTRDTFPVLRAILRDQDHIDPNQLPLIERETA